MDAKTGKTLEGIEHLKQSIIDILTTPINSRIMRRDYGSRLFELVDKSINRDLTLEIYSAVAEALQRWEERFKLEKVKMTEVKEGKVTLDLEGLYLYQFPLLGMQIGDIAELFNCGVGKRSNKFAQSGECSKKCVKPKKKVIN